MLSEVQCNECGTVFLYEVDHPGAVCPKCHRVDDFTILTQRVLPHGKISLEREEDGNGGPGDDWKEGVFS